MVAPPSGSLPAVWEPQPGPQEALLACPIADLLYGGARGGGKTDGLLGDWLSYQDQYGGQSQGIFFRKTYPELEAVEARALELFPASGATYLKGKRTWLFPNGATFKLRYLKRDQDASLYQGHSYSYMAADELTNWPSAAPIDKLKATLRSVHGLPCLFRASANPGGPGHNWVKARYIDPAPPWTPFEDVQTLSDGTELRTQRVFIPSTLDDNQLLTAKDPQYWQRVVEAANGREDLIKAWRWGLWDIVAGGMFDDLYREASHVLPPFTIPAAWKLDRSFDWGSSRPFSVGWWAESDGTTATLADGTTRTFPRGSLFRLGEWYGWIPNKPNEGSKMLAVDVGRGILEREAHMGLKGRVRPGPADSSIFDTENGVCIATDMEKVGCRWERADKSPGSRKNGWERLRSYLKAARDGSKDDPHLYVFSNCRQWIRTVPVLPRDDTDPDDVDTAAEDHPADETRYRLLAVKREVKAQKLSGV
jgi:hypothetical protein